MLIFCRKDTDTRNEVLRCEADKQCEDHADGHTRSVSRGKGMSFDRVTRMATLMFQPGRLAVAYLVSSLPEQVPCWPWQAFGPFQSPRRSLTVFLSFL